MGGCHNYAANASFLAYSPIAKNNALQYVLERCRHASYGRDIKNSI